MPRRCLPLYLFPPLVVPEVSGVLSFGGRRMTMTIGCTTAGKQRFPALLGFGSPACRSELYILV
ncbi:hypothetical protein I7I50_11304 [Histoplasma capsulatum G186AR]|uniref:Uncharacterized protein n=1 Tax=Ajellomyces capsulatus TaxID=5037 RepID=A0A8H7Z516_AJECA|nr:hypothetical protein I7I52_02542 [Histoplasma capsulatum]QSS69868.1 hypothetical protein I7I50_11304 [Histoplasma capsulatum G186AR]